MTAESWDGITYWLWGHSVRNSPNCWIRVLQILYMAFANGVHGVLECCDWHLEMVSTCMPMHTVHVRVSIVVEAFLFSERAFFTSVDCVCEIGGSQYNLVKRDTRSSLPMSNVETPMVISMEAKPLNTFSLMKPPRSGFRHRIKRGLESLIRRLNPGQR